MEILDKVYSDQELMEMIKEERKKKPFLILVHNYQRGEIQDIGDYVGDSLGLSQKAAQTDESIIIFCGVYFMAETAYILNPTKKVILPELEAGCPMADMISAKSLRQMKAEYPEAKVVCYVNSTAEVKAESDICCTSSNAIKVVQSVDSEQIIFIPDKNLGKYISRFSDKEIILWEGFCPTHHKIKLEQVKKVKKEHPGVVFLAHPECRPEVLDEADFIGSTSQIFNKAREIKEREILIGSEIGMKHRLEKENPGKVFYFPSKETICPNMKLITLEKVLSSLRNLEPVVTVPEEIRKKSYKAVEKMLEIT